MKEMEKRDFDKWGYDTLTTQLRTSKKVRPEKTFKSIQDEAIDRKAKLEELERQR